MEGITALHVFEIYIFMDILIGTSRIVRWKFTASLRFGLLLKNFHLSVTEAIIWHVHLHASAWVWQLTTLPVAISCVMSSKHHLCHDRPLSQGSRQNQWWMASHCSCQYSKPVTRTFRSDLSKIVTGTSKSDLCKVECSIHALLT